MSRKWKTHGGRNPGKDIQILQYLCCILAQCYKDNFHHEMANNGPLQGERDVSLMLVVCAQHCWEGVNLILLAVVSSSLAKLWVPSAAEKVGSGGSTGGCVISSTTWVWFGFLLGTAALQLCSGSHSKISLSERVTDPHMRYWLLHRWMRDATNSNRDLKGKCWELLAWIQNLKPLCLHLKVW